MLRSMDKVEIETGLLAIAYNLKKLGGKWVRSPLQPPA